MSEQKAKLAQEFQAVLQKEVEEKRQLNEKLAKVDQTETSNKISSLEKKLKDMEALVVQV